MQFIIDWWKKVFARIFQYAHIVLWLSVGKESFLSLPVHMLLLGNGQAILKMQGIVIAFLYDGLAVIEGCAK
ncbi:hypothetical protein EVA_18697 [gut metagenome]|uniref:Uncharacterized protein n=1 Tax=gut metagenome TaxID=749906 RepID=J9FE60_9ZZZZ